MLWFKALKGFSMFVVLVGLTSLSEHTLTITLRELGGILIVIGAVGYLLARGALGHVRRSGMTVESAND